MKNTRSASPSSSTQLTLLQKLQCDEWATSRSLFRNFYCCIVTYSCDVPIFPHRIMWVIVRALYVASLLVLITRLKHFGLAVWTQQSISARGLGRFNTCDISACVVQHLFMRGSLLAFHLFLVPLFLWKAITFPLLLLLVDQWIAAALSSLFVWLFPLSSSVRGCISMSSPLTRDWVGIQQFPAATQNKLLEILGKLKEEVHVVFSSIMLLTFNQRYNVLDSPCTIPMSTSYSDQQYIFPFINFVIISFLMLQGFFLTFQF